MTELEPKLELAVKVQDKDDPFGGIGIKAEDKLFDGRLKMALIGKPKTWKSWLAATAPGSIFIADLDGRAESLRYHPNKSNLLVKTYVDLNQTNVHAIMDLESDLATFKYRKKSGLRIPDTFVFDGNTKLKVFMENEIIRQQPQLAKNIKAGPQILKIPANYDVYNTVRLYMDYFINEFYALGHFIMVFHEAPEKDKAESAAEKLKDSKAPNVYTDKVTCDPSFMTSILSSFNEVFRVGIDNSNHFQLTTGITVEFNGASSMFLDTRESINDIRKLIEKHKQRVKEGWMPK